MRPEAEGRAYSWRGRSREDRICGRCVENPIAGGRVALALLRSADAQPCLGRLRDPYQLVVQPEHRQAEEPHEVIGTEGASLVNVDVEELAQGAEVANLPVVRVRLHHPVEPRLPESRPDRDQLEGAVRLRLGAEE